MYECKYVWVCVSMSNIYIGMCIYVCVSMCICIYLYDNIFICFSVSVCECVCNIYIHIVGGRVYIIVGR